MVKRFEFTDRTIFLIRKLMENQLPLEATLTEMVEKRDELLKRLMHEEVK